MQPFYDQASNFRKKLNEMLTAGEDEPNWPKKLPWRLHLERQSHLIIDTAKYSSKRNMMGFKEIGPYQNEASLSCFLHAVAVPLFVYFRWHRTPFCPIFSYLSIQISSLSQICISANWLPSCKVVSVSCLCMRRLCCLAVAYWIGEDWSRTVWIRDITSIIICHDDI